MALKNRMELAASFSGVGVEVGVEAGKFSSAILSLGRVAHLYSIDPWVPVPNFYSEATALQAFHLATSRLTAFLPRSTVLRQDARIAVQGFPDESLDFVYIDSSHEFDETHDEILCWYPKLKPGGILSGHDYANGPEVRRAVDLFAALNGLIAETTEKDDDLNFDFLITSWIIKKPA